ncbi:plasmid replication/partition related protein [Rhodoferax lacus]|uniref:Plasmid replication/partition related protein n=1 Tax=Rhodoferax lacus TaxID=2184758 RepID=A0A3E1R8Y4_9BURK|nr:plasmid replication/partition related protein [Rhodoferax lacus]RFO95816.1 plasmid replication/partition related protein [Rhodoferax lacus]
MNIVVDPELKAYIDPLTPDEHEALERSLLSEGCRDALVLWGDVLVDGHNRYGICQQHGIPFQTLQSTLFKSMDDVHLWMIEQHLGRRSVSDFQRGVLALRRREILAARKQHAAALKDAGPASTATEAGAPDATSAAPAQPLPSREDLARSARLSSSQVGMIERIQKQAAPEVVAAVKSGTISINAAAAVATLPAQEQVAAAQGGREELQQAAKRVRESKKRDKAAKADSEEVSEDQAPDSVPALKARIQVLEAENAQLREQLGALRAAA